MSSEEKRNSKTCLDATFSTNDVYIVSKNSSSDVNGTIFHTSHESDDDFSALDLLLSNILPSQDKLPQDVGVTEKEARVKKCESSSDLENNPSASLVLNVPRTQPMHQLEQLAWDDRKRELCEDTPLKRIKRPEFTEEVDEVGKSNQVFSSKFKREHSTENRCQGNINEGNQLTERQEAAGNNYPNLHFQLWNSDSNNVSYELYTSNSVEQQTGESFNPSTDGECSKTAFTTSEHLLKQSRVVSLAAHMNIVDKPYKCDQCSKSYKLKSQLKTHYALHKKAIPFKCCYCDFVTQWNDNLIEHVNDKHGLCVQQDFHLSEQQSMASNDD